MKTRNSFTTICFLLAVAQVFYAPSAYPQNANAQHAFPDRWSVGISAANYGYDPGLGLEITTPPIWSQKLSLRLRGNYAWVEAYKVSTGHWASYTSFAAGMVYHSQLYERARIQVEIGLFNIVPDHEISIDKNMQGIYELTGLEFFIVNKEEHHLAYHFGAGLSHAFAYAEKIEGRPRLGNGFVFINGFRFYL
jgi:hypothetical protein